MKLLISKTVLDGLKDVKCERSICGKNSPICYIPEQDPIEEVLESKHQPTPVKLTLLPGSEMREIRWALGTHDPFLLHVSRAIHVIKEMEHHTKFQEAVEAVKI